MFVAKTSCCVQDLSDLSAVKDVELDSWGSSGQACKAFCHSTPTSFYRGWRGEKWLQAKRPTEREGVGSEALLAVGPTSEGRPERGSGQASTTALQGQLQEGARAQGKKCSSGRGMEGSGGSKREGAGDGPLQPPAGPLLWEHTEPNEFDSLLSSINHAMQNISPF